MAEPSSPEKLGKGMLIAAWIVALLFVTWLFSQWLESKNNPNQEVKSQIGADGVREVTLLRNPDGHYVASGRINRQPVVFMLDTGATLVSVPGDLAKRLGLEKGPPLRANTANGTVTVFFTRLESISLGDIQMQDVRASINPQMRGDEVLLGMSFLRPLEFTQRGEEIVLRQYPG